MGKSSWHLSTSILSCRAQLEKAEVLCCPEDLCACLGSWLRALHVYRSKLLGTSTEEDQEPSKDEATTIPSILSPASPHSPLIPTVVTSVTHLATLCAELAVYSEDKSDDPTHQPEVHLSFAVVNLL